MLQLKEIPSVEYTVRPYEVVDRADADTYTFKAESPSKPYIFMQGPEILSEYSSYLEEAKLERLSKEIPPKWKDSQKVPWKYHPAQKISIVSRKSSSKQPVSSESTALPHYHLSSVLRDSLAEAPEPKAALSVDSHCSRSIWSYRPSILERVVSASPTKESKSKAALLSNSVDQPLDTLDSYMDQSAVVTQDKKQQTKKVDLKILSHKQQQEYKVYKHRIESGKVTMPRKGPTLIKQKLETKHYLTPSELAHMNGKGKVSDLLLSAKVQLSRCREFDLPLPKTLFSTEPNRQKPRPVKPAKTAAERPPQPESLGETHTNLSRLRSLTQEYGRDRLRRSYHLHKVVEVAQYRKDEPLWQNVRQKQLDQDYFLYQLLRPKLQARQPHASSN